MIEQTVSKCLSFAFAQTQAKLTHKSEVRSQKSYNNLAVSLPNRGVFSTPIPRVTHARSNPNGTGFVKTEARRLCQTCQVGWLGKPECWNCGTPTQAIINKTHKHAS